MKPVGPIETVHLFPPLHMELMTLLKGLSPADWLCETVCAGWQVRDIVAHLLDGDIRKLSPAKEGSRPPAPESPINGYQDLVSFLNQINADWIRATGRMSPRLLIDFLAITGPQVSELLAGLDPNANARHSVAWAGELISPNWFDIAREYTEKWHHQQQIRDAVGAPGLTRRQWLFPALDTFVRALPHTYREVDAGEGATILVTITGEAGGEWSLVQRGQGWILYSGAAPSPVCRIKLDQDAAWRLFTKQPNQQVHIRGDLSLGNVFLDTLAVMA
jgi:uncharacterized protein (TIGR03083 family)